MTHISGLWLAVQLLPKFLEKKGGACLSFLFSVWLILQMLSASSCFANLTCLGKMLLATARYQIFGPFSLREQKVVFPKALGTKGSNCWPCVG